MHLHLAHLPDDSLESVAAPLTLGCHRLEGGVLITVIGEVDITNADRLQRYVREQMLPGKPAVLDLSLLTFMDSNGGRVLNSLHTTLRDEGTSLHLAGVHGISARLLQIIGLWPLLNIHASAADAVIDVLSHQAAPLRSEPEHL